jgi:hypothetical protein
MGCEAMLDQLSWLNKDLPAEVTGGSVAAD